MKETIFGATEPASPRPVSSYDPLARTTCRVPDLKDQPPGAYVLVAGQGTHVALDTYTVDPASGTFRGYRRGAAPTDQPVLIVEFPLTALWTVYATDTLDTVTYEEVALRAYADSDADQEMHRRAHPHESALSVAPTPDLIKRSGYL